MKKYALSLLALVAFVSGFSQTLTTQVRPLDQKEWGYINLAGEMIIKPQFRKCYEFSQGFAPIYESKEKSYRLIDLSGNRLSTPELEKFLVVEGMGFGVQGFSEGLIAVAVNDKWGFLNTSGKLAIPLKYSFVSKFDGGFATAILDEKFYVLSATGTETPITVENISAIKPFSEGLAPFVDKEGNSGFINTSGKVVIESKFLSTGYFTNGLAWAKNADGKVGFIDPTGEWAIQPTFLVARDFDKEAGLARIKSETGWGYVDKKGVVKKIDITVKWGDFSEGLAQGSNGELMGFYNAAGEWVIQPSFQGVRDFKNGYAAAKKDDKWGMIDKSGNWVIQPIYGGIKDMEISN